MYINVNTKTLKRISVIVSILAIIAILITGTYAWRDYSQHKSNEFSNEQNKKFDVRLVEDFDAPTDWTTTDLPIKKEIRVASVGGAQYGDVLVRIQLKEYMEIGEVSYVYTDSRYAVTKHGSFVIFNLPETATSAQLQEAIEGTPYEGYELTYLTDAVENKTGWFVKSGANQINGQYGKFVPEEVKIGEAESLVNGVERADAEVSSKHDALPDGTGECAYTPHTWTNTADDCGEVFHSYVKWLLGDDVISMTEWLDEDGDYKGEQAKKWVYDDTQEDGWVYWLEPLKPGQTTENLLNEVKLILQPSGPFYYTIHADMQAISLDELGKANPEWSAATPVGNKAPEAIVDALLNK